MSKIEPGCLAICVGMDDDDPCPPLNGWVVRVGARSHLYPEGWAMDPPIVDPADGEEVHVWEGNLQPLDNPPDSAADLLLAPLPKQDKVPA